MTLAALISRKCYVLWYSKHTGYLVFLNSLTVKNHTKYAKKEENDCKRKTIPSKIFGILWKMFTGSPFSPFAYFFIYFLVVNIFFFFQSILKHLSFQTKQKNLIYLWIIFTGSVKKYILIYQYLFSVKKKEEKKCRKHGRKTFNRTTSTKIFILRGGENFFFFFFMQKYFFIIKTTIVNNNFCKNLYMHSQGCKNSALAGSLSSLTFIHYFVIVSVFFLTP